MTAADEQNANVVAITADGKLFARQIRGKRLAAVLRPGNSGGSGRVVGDSYKGMSELARWVPGSRPGSGNTARDRCGTITPKPTACVG